MSHSDVIGLAIGLAGVIIMVTVEGIIISLVLERAARDIVKAIKERPDAGKTAQADIKLGRD